MTLQDLEPRRLWNHFADLTAIPRPSNGEARARQFVQDLAEGWGLRTAQDARGNLVVYKAASPGREGRPTVVLQAHLDMVMLSTEPVRPIVEGEWVKAQGTTLGADNGIGVAAALAILEDRTLVHGPLEAIFTVDEEEEMTGAAEFDASLVSGRLLLNLDGEGPGRFIAGSAGGGVVHGALLVTLSPPDAPAGWLVRLSGLAGGHSGSDIHTEPGNALALLARFCEAFLRAQGGAFQLASLEGGEKDNAIPPEAEALLAGPADPLALHRAADAFAALAAAELGPLGTGLRLEAAEAPLPEAVLTPADQQRFLDLITAVPTGVLGRSKIVAGLVETSANLGKLRVADGLATLVVSPRSGSEGLLADAVRSISAAIRLAGGTVGRAPTYPAWTAAPRSRLRDTACAVWQELSGTPATVELIHAGLECGYWAEKLPGVDMLSFGADALDLHTVRERVHIGSVATFYQFTLKLLEAL